MAVEAFSFPLEVNAMRMLLSILVATPLLLPVTGLAAPEAGGSFIGLFADVEATLCDAPLDTAFEVVTVYVFASLNPAYLTGLEGARFKLSNLPPLGTGNWTATWDGSPGVTGEIDTGVLLQWPAPLAGPLVMLGNVEFQGFDSGWIGADHLIQVQVADGQTELSVWAEGGAEFQVQGGGFTFNCGGSCPCSPTTALDEASWGSIKALY